MKKPKRLDDYKEWMRTNHGIKIDDRLARYYDAASLQILNQFTESNLWRMIVESLTESNMEYYISTNGYHLLTGKEPLIVRKPFESVIEKSYRKNILSNRSWPEAPQNGWILPENWFTKINDIIRGLIVVKYIDGVKFLVEKISEICCDQGCKCKAHFEAREEGYYAAHLYIEFEVEIPGIQWDARREVIKVELQITTQLQEVIRKLLHQHYEKRRIETNHSDDKWQWNYKSDEFSANYLGHILHYIEGMILEIRDKDKEEDTC